MTLTDRDRKILTFILPVIVLGLYWFLVLSPKREESASLGDRVVQAESDRDAAVAQADQAAQARESFDADYASMVRLGKAVPSSVDMPSLLVQLDRASAGTGIRFQSITAGERTGATAADGSTPPDSGSSPSGDAAAGGTPAGTGPGQAAEKADEASETSDAANTEAGADAPADTGDATTAGSAAAVPGALDTVPLTFTFNGSFFNLADFFHQLKRYVRLSGGAIDVRGRLLTIDSLTLTPTDFPRMEAQVTATVYLSPKTDGVTAGATPQGPAPADSGATPASTDGSSTATPAAAAAAQ